MNLSIYRGRRRRAHIAAALVSLFGFIPAASSAAAGGVVSLPAAPVSSPTASRSPNVGYDKATGRLWVDARQADLGLLLRMIAEKSGIAIEVGEGVSGRLTIAFDNVPLEAGVSRIVEAAGARNLAAEYSRRTGDGAPSFDVEKITILRKDSTAGGMAAGAGQGAEIRGAERPTTGSGATLAPGAPIPGGLQALLLEYGDPRTTRQRKKKLSEKIRRTGVRTPQEKADLKRAVLAGQVGGESSKNLEAALLRAMREHPEGSDVEYVLELMRKEARPGNLILGMVAQGNKRHLDYLTRSAEGGSVYAIRLIGMAQLTQAKPVLEQIVSSPAKKGSPGWRAAEESLRRLKAQRTALPPGAP